MFVGILFWNVMATQKHVDNMFSKFGNSMATVGLRVGLAGEIGESEKGKDTDGKKEKIRE
jgi:hypothetical protein